MKKYLLLFLVIVMVAALVIGSYLEGKVILIQIVIPENLLPYYEWLISFPGVESHPARPTPEQIPLYNIYKL